MQPYLQTMPHNVSARAVGPGVGRFRQRALALAAALGVLLLGWQAALGAPPADSFVIFNSVGVRRANLKPFPKWTGMLERYFEEQGAAAGSCEATRFNRCHLQAWYRLLDELRGQPESLQLAVVNAYMNRHRYIVDQINWGVDDYWETPREFFSRFGDCEDYAIAKYLTLLALGYDEARLRVVIVQDLNLRVPHAVLAVLGEDGTRILDNQIRPVVNEATIRHYRPIYSINGQAWWMHRPARG